MGLMKKGDPTTVVGEGSASTVTTSPKPPPPKAPMATYARCPSIRSHNFFRGKGCEGGPEGKSKREGIERLEESTASRRDD